MAELPDLNTGEISWIAYYNIVDQGGLQQEFDITEVTSSGNITSQTLYDNGVEGKYTDTDGATLSFRAKSDGWIVAWKDRTGSDTPMQGGKPDGKWDFVSNWTEVSGRSDGDGPKTKSIDQNSLERCINDLQSQLSNSTGISYSSADVGVYNYEYSGATTATLFTQYYSEDQETRSTNIGVTYTSDTTIYSNWALVKSYITDGGGGMGHSRYTFDGTTLHNQNNNFGTYFSARNLKFLGLGDTPGVEASGEVSVYNDLYDSPGINVSQITTWG